LLDVLTFAAALGCALMAGLFFAFSVAVMKALGALPPPQGIAAMQSINLVIVNPWFLTVFFGTGAVCIAVIVVALLDWSVAGTAFAVAGGLLYLLGTLLVTIVFNVPRNNALAKALPTSNDGALLWTDYLVTWTGWNHVRTVAALAATACLILALVYSGRG
jgi:uncharacterized membrane protein